MYFLKHCLSQPTACRHCHCETCIRVSPACVPPEIPLLNSHSVDLQFLPSPSLPAHMPTCSMGPFAFGRSSLHSCLGWGDDVGQLLTPCPETTAGSKMEVAREEALPEPPGALLGAWNPRKPRAALLPLLWARLRSSAQ